MYFVWKFENYDKFQLSYSSILFTETLHTFRTYQYLQKGVQDFLYFVYILSYLQKFERPSFFLHLFFTFLLKTQDLNKIKKISNTFF